MGDVSVGPLEALVATGAAWRDEASRGYYLPR